MAGNAEHPDPAGAAHQDHVDHPIREGASPGLGHEADFSVAPDGAFAGVQESGGASHQGGLARAVWPQYCGRGARLHE